MINLTLIQKAHRKVRSGADFPAYIQEIKRLGVAYYATFVTDGHTDYRTKDGLEVKAPPQYPPIAISEEVNPVQLKMDIAEHQQGKSDYFGIIRQCASHGVKNWAVNLDEMTCTYFDNKGKVILVEQIPDHQKQKTEAK